jgi:hypothetical protein
MSPLGVSLKPNRRERRAEAARKRKASAKSHAKSAKSATTAAGRFVREEVSRSAIANRISPRY